MATITARTENPKNGESGISVVVWEQLNSDDDAGGVIVNGPSTAACSMQVVGTFGSATVTLQGSNDGTNWAVLSDINGSTDGLTTAGIAEYSVSTVYLRPVATGGTGSQDVDIYLACRS